MGENDYSTVSMIANERADIGITASSTPTGKRGTFYKMCTDPSMGYSHHFHPSFDNPNYTKEMDDAAKTQFTQVQYEHEILAEFGTEEAGVFDKEKVDAAMKREWYAYDELTDIQLRNIEGNVMPTMYLYDEYNPAPPNVFRCIGIDWDAYQAGSSILVLDFDTQRKKFKVLKKVEVPRGEYTLDNAVNWVIKMNEIYRPSWIFCDRGYGDYQVERLHLYGEEHPSSGLKNKVVGYQFKQTIDVFDPVTRQMTKEPMKQFMVNQLKLTFERDNIILCPFDEGIHKQLIDYSVDHISQSGLPVYTSKNEHFVDALGLAHLAFVLKFPDITGAIKVPKNSTKLEFSSVSLNKGGAALRSIESGAENPWKTTKMPPQIGKDPGERKGDYQKWIKVPMGGKSHSENNFFSWGSRSGRSRGYEGRSLW